jgi:hypothetical protein
LRAVDDGHPAAADPFQQFIAPVEYQLLIWHSGDCKTKAVWPQVSKEW